NPRHARVGFHERAVRGRVERVLDDEPLGIARLRVEVARAADEPVRVQARELREQRVARERRVTRERAVRRQPVVEREPERDLPALAPRALVDGNAELERRDEVRREAQQPLALLERLAHEPDLEVLEVAEPAVNEPRGRAARATGEIVALDEEHREPRERGLARDRGAVDAPADHDHVERSARGRGGRRFARVLAQGRVWPVPRTWYL